MNQTQQNLLKAFAGESQARNKYYMFAKMARKENFEWIARVFEETADNERTHAEELFEQISDAVKAPGELSIAPFKKTTDNLKMAAEGEKYEWTTMYPDFEKIAIEEKEEKAAKLFGQLKLVEEKHEERYIILAKKLDNKTLYDSEVELEWKCVNCGYIYKGKQPPMSCPVCVKPFTWYMPLGLVR
ncbi:rubrerythrin family protein [Candidatus Roizmanbacteria bacterium]|nr:rubrerythrin family protein [Candidatus Roizmanbacteria bacterium]